MLNGFQDRVYSTCSLKISYLENISLFENILSWKYLIIWKYLILKILLEQKAGTVENHIQIFTIASSPNLQDPVCVGKIQYVCITGYKGSALFASVK